MILLSPADDLDLQRADVGVGYAECLELARASRKT
jgi:hypothetical protein